MCICMRAIRLTSNNVVLFIFLIFISHSNSLTNTRSSPILTPSNHLQIKLTKDNYLSWKTAILPYINGSKILKHVDDTTGAPPQTIPDPTTPTLSISNPAYETWFEVDQLLLRVLVSTISEPLVSNLVGLTSSKAVWVSLEKMFSSQSCARIMQTRYNLATLCKGNLSITDYFQKAKSLSDLLSSIGEPLNDSNLTSAILAGLPFDYNSLVISVNTRLEDVSLDELYGHLLTHELRLEQQNTPPDLGAPTANFVDRNTPPSSHGRSFQNPTPRGNGSRGRGSIGRGRGSSQPQFFGQNNQSSRPFCQLRFKGGHTAQSCWHRFDQTFQLPSPPQSQAFMTTTASPIDQVWYLDTGATNHITSDLANITYNTEDYRGPDQVRVGNGQGLQIHHIGSSILCSSSKNFFLTNILHVPQIRHNLLSLYQFAKDNNVFFEFHPSFFCVKDLFSAATLLKGVTVVSTLSILYNVSQIIVLLFSVNVCPLINGI
uniref:Retrovirus-related Pol polyprotein from transposon TNT 1-94-like beta-barrel domain-containing protein n=1 Tax=Fagus sylvatica TaxID=28930 RepID=A0A2N9GHH1_FAGSY